MKLFHLFWRVCLFCGVVWIMIRYRRVSFFAAGMVWGWKNISAGLKNGIGRDSHQVVGWLRFSG